MLKKGDLRTFEEQMQPPPFPTTTSELDAWHVYGDWLQTTNDPAEQRRGELIARELALPAAITDKATLREYHAAARRVCRHPRGVVTAFCLGHVRTMSIVASMRLVMRERGPDQSSLSAARDILQKPFAARLEELAFVYEHPPTDGRKFWTRLMAAVPASCTRMGITLLQPITQEQVDGFLSFIPSNVREISVGWAAGRRGTNISEAPQQDQCLASLLNNRFERVTLLMDLGAMPLGSDLLAQLARTSGTRLRIRSTFDLRSIKNHSRIEIGAPGDAFLTRAFLDESNMGTATSVVVLRRWRLVDLQLRYGIVPIRTLLESELRERYSIHRNPPAMIVIGMNDADIARRNHVWTLRGQADRNVSVNGLRVTEGIRVIEYGDRLTFDDDSEWTLQRDLPSENK